MKECPQCKRTYADDTITFCLADGSLLSAPYDPPQMTQASPRSEPPTEIIPFYLLPTVKQSSNRKYVVVGVLCLLIGGGVVAWFYSGGQNVAETPSVGASQTTPTPTATPARTTLSPTETVTAYYEANNKRDVAAIKKYLSKGTMELMEKGAKSMNKSVDDAIKDSLATSPNVTPQYSAEKINGDTATVEMSAQGQMISMPLVKEGGEWKIAIDKLLQNMGSKIPSK